MRVALDTNILVYAEGVNGEERASRVRAALDDCAGDELVVSAQALAELFTVLMRKAKWTPVKAREAVLSWYDACVVVDTTAAVLLEAMHLTELHQYSLWDSVMLAAAAQAGCGVLLSEDMQAGLSGAAWRYEARSVEAIRLSPDRGPDAGKDTTEA